MLFEVPYSKWVPETDKSTMCWYWGTFIKRKYNYIQLSLKYVLAVSDMLIY